MTDFVTLYMRVDASGMVAGDKALDGLARKAAVMEDKVGDALDGVAAKAKRSLDATAASVRKTTDGFDKAAKSSASAASGFSQTAQQADKLGKASRAATAQTANLTSQFNDIAVMMAAGQNPIQLAMQQGTQISQVLTQMGGGVGAVKALGGAFLAMLNPISLATIGTIAFGAAAAQWLTGASDAAEKLDDQMDALTDAFEAYKAAADIANLATGAAAAEFGNAAGAAAKYHGIMAEINQLILQRNIKAAGGSMLEAMGADFAPGSAGIFANERGVADFFDLGSVNFGQQAKKLRGDIQGLITDLREFQNAATVAEQIETLGAAYEKAYDFASRNGDPNAEQEALLNLMMQTLNVLLKIRTEEEAIANLTTDRAREAGGIMRQQWEERAKAAADEIEKLQQQADMNRLVAFWGADSVQVTRARVQAEREAYSELVRSKYGANQLSDAMLEAWDGANGVASVDMAGNISLAEGATWTWASAMADVREEVSAIMSAIASLGGGMISNAGKFVELNALKAGQTAAQAARARKEWDMKREFDVREAGAGTWMERMAIKGERAVAMRGLDLDDELGTARAAARKAERSSGGRGGKGGKGRQGFTDSAFDVQRQTQAMLEQADAIAKVVAAGGDWERALRVLEEEQKLLNAAQQAGVELTPQVRAQIKGLAEDYVTAEEKLEAVREKQQELEEATRRGEDAFGNLFGAILEGSDAAKKALIDLIAQIALAQFKAGAMGLLNGLGGGGLISAVGGLLGGKSYDGGGYTGDGPRSGGLDGKGGFLAMMHPQETVTDHTKPGGSAGGVRDIRVVVGVDPANGNIMGFVDERAERAAASMGQAINAAMPARVQQINQRPRKR